ncbi:MAG: 4Fe-4S binding protein [Actinomycetes bacterium]
MTAVPRSSPLAANRLKRLGGFAVGLVLFYAPFALLVRGVGWLFPASTAGTSISDVHSACLRMPLGWLTQPWMWPTLGSSPISWLPIAILPLAAVAAGPLFCGWVCPAGALPEYLSRAVPDRLKFDFKDRVDIVPLRYGFFAGILLVPFVSSSICCSLCNFNQMQNLVSGVFGNFSGFAYFSTMGVIAATLWIVPLGLFTKGGRGWCLFLCPAGAMMGLASWASAKLPWAFRVRSSGSACTSCGTCQDVCPMRAVQVTPEAEQTINRHLCIECQDCVSACPDGALQYGRPS